MADLRVALQDVQAEIDSGRVLSDQGKSIPHGLSILYAEDESKGGDMLVENPR